MFYSATFKNALSNIESGGGGYKSLGVFPFPELLTTDVSSGFLFHLNELIRIVRIPYYYQDIKRYFR